jgi:PAS domain S-box-containing protein
MLPSSRGQMRLREGDQAQGRGIEPRPMEEVGHPTGLGSQWCNRLLSQMVVAGFVCRSMEVHIVAGKVDEQLRFQARLLDAVGQSVIATDLEGNILYWNRAAEDLYGYSSEEALGRKLRDLTLSEELLDRAEGVVSDLRAGKTWSGETLLRRNSTVRAPRTGRLALASRRRGRLHGPIQRSA